MQALKILVGVMTTLIIVGVTVLVFVIIGRIQTNAGNNNYRVELPEPPAKGSKLIDMVGVDKLLVLRYETPDRQTQLQVIDPANGKLRGVIEVKAVP
ncbi:MAG: hypothetical protein QM523_02100 [Candidatus Pacebacteria bacterium]|nr:hypothetical protein [Candidatus Paceibacterota bacterium]